MTDIDASSRSDANLDVEKKKIARDLVIPRWADAESVKAHLIGQGGIFHKQLVRRTRCKLSLLGTAIETHTDSPFKLYIHMRGSRSDVEVLTSIIMRRVSESVDDIEDMHRMLFEIAAQNRDIFQWEGEALFQRLPPDFEEEEWMTIVYLDRNHSNYSGLFVGSHGMGMKGVIKSSGCSKVSLREESKRPHVVVTGKTSNAVRLGRLKVQGRLDWARKKWETEFKSYELHRSVHRFG